MRRRPHWREEAAAIALAVAFWAVFLAAGWLLLAV